MKNLIIGIGSAMVLIMVVLILYTVQAENSRSNEEHQTIIAALENTVAKMQNENTHYRSNEEFKIAFVQNLITQLDAASDVTIRILDADYEKGLIRVEVIEEYQNPNTDTDKPEESRNSVSVTRTIIIEKHKEEKI